MLNEECKLQNEIAILKEQLDEIVGAENFENVFENFLINLGY